MYLQIKTFSSGIYKCLKCSSMLVCFKDLYLNWSHCEVHNSSHWCQILELNLFLSFIQTWNNCLLIFNRYNGSLSLRWHILELSLPSIARVHITQAKQLIKHEIPLATKQLSQSDISWIHQHIFFVSSNLRVKRSFNSLLKGLLGFLQLWVFKITTN